MKLQNKENYYSISYLVNNSRRWFKDVLYCLDFHQRGDFGRRQCSHLSLVVVDMIAALELVAALSNCGPTWVDFGADGKLPVSN